MLPISLRDLVITRFNDASFTPVNDFVLLRAVERGGWSGYVADSALREAA